MDASAPLANDAGHFLNEFHGSGLNLRHLSPALLVQNMGLKPTNSLSVRGGKNQF